MTGTGAGPEGPVVLHASAVAWDGRAVLILGPSGAGKSALALALMGYGAVLVADDRTRLDLCDGALRASCPPAIAGRIEARGLGLLAAETVAAADVALVVDLSADETDRLPPLREFSLLGVRVPLVHRVESGHFPAAVLQYLKRGRVG